MFLKPQREGETWTLTIDLGMLDQGALTPDTEFRVTTDGRAILITPVEDGDDIGDAEFATITERIHERYGRALQRLAGSAPD